jgi:recombination protein RecR
MNVLPPALQSLINELAKLPGIGPKTAQRLSIHLLKSPHSRIKPLGEALLNLKDGLKFCEECWHVSESEKCAVCDDEARDRSVICVLEDVLDVIAIEKSNEYNGIYHVLHGVLSPIDGVGPEQIKVQELFYRIKKNPEIKELILATNPTMEGEATCMYIMRYVQKKLPNLKISRIARGLPIGGDLEYADAATLGKALQNRTSY